MPVTWPAFLQDLLNQAGFTLSPQDNVLRSNSETGAAKVRARTTKRVDTYSSTINIEIAQYTDWDNFYTVALNNGVNTFTFNHPFTQVPSVFRFARSPKITPLGGVTLTIAMDWELLP